MKRSRIHRWLSLAFWIVFIPVALVLSVIIASVIVLMAWVIGL